MTAGDKDLIVLDINLPDGDGLSLLKELRRDGDATPVLMLTARGSVDDRVSGLESGANDYLPKPFSFRELVARIRVLLRPPNVGSDQLTISDLTLDVHARQATRAGKPIALTNKELSLLEVLMRSPGRPVSRMRLWDAAWDGSFEANSNVLDVHMSRLRRKVDEGYKVGLIQTVYGAGYKIEARQSS